MGGHRGFFVGCVAIVALVVGLVSGCSGAQGASGPDASPSRSASASASVSATPSSTSSGTLDDEARARIPKAARAHTAKGAEAFARFYLEQFNQAWVDAEPAWIQPYALETCKTCVNFVETAVWLRDNRLHYSGPPTVVGPSAWLPESTSNRVLVQIVNNQQRRQVLRADGGVEEKLEATPALNEVELHWREQSWLVAAIRIVK